MVMLGDKVMLGEPSAAKYKECYDMWISSYENVYIKMSRIVTKSTFEDASCA